MRPAHRSKRKALQIPLVVLGTVGVLLMSGLAGWGVVTLIQGDPETALTAALPQTSVTSTTPAPVQAPPAAPTSLTPTDQMFVALLTGTGFAITTDNQMQYVEEANKVCVGLWNGEPVLDNAADIPGTNTDNAEGFVYISASVYCDELSPLLP